MFQRKAYTKHNRFTTEIKILEIRLCFDIGYTPKIFSGLFNQREINPYNLRRGPEFRVPLTRTLHHGSESISYLGTKIWDILLTSFKEGVSLKSFKRLIKKWVPQACHCRLSKN